MATLPKLTAAAWRGKEARLGRAGLGNLAAGNASAPQHGHSPIGGLQPHSMTSALLQDLSLTAGLSPIAGLRSIAGPQPHSRLHSRPQPSKTAPLHSRPGLHSSTSEPRRPWPHITPRTPLRPPLFPPDSASSAPPLPALLLRMRTASRPAAAQAQCCPLAAARRACRGCGGGCAECGAAGWGCGAGAVAMQGAYRGMLSQAEPCEHTGGCKRSGGRQ